MGATPVTMCSTTVLCLVNANPYNSYASLKRDVGQGPGEGRCWILTFNREQGLRDTGEAAEHKAPEP